MTHADSQRIANAVNKARQLPKSGYAVTALQVRQVWRRERKTKAGSSHPVEQEIIALARKAKSSSKRKM